MKLVVDLLMEFVLKEEREDEGNGKDTDVDPEHASNREVIYIIMGGF